MVNVAKGTLTQLLPTTQGIMALSKRGLCLVRDIAHRSGSYYARRALSTSTASSLWMPENLQGSTDSYINNPNVQHKRIIDEALRVDHAGEVAAVWIYEGQMWVLKGTSAYPTISEMREGEVKHLHKMEELVASRRARPTALLPIVHAAAFALGAGTALLGREAAMACTVAVETVIGQHYNDQIRDVLASGIPEDELLKTFKVHRDEELQHLDTAKVNDAERAPFYNILSSVVKAGCQAAIWIAKKV